MVGKAVVGQGLVSRTEGVGADYTVTPDQWGRVGLGLVSACAKGGSHRLCVFTSWAYVSP